MKFKCFVEYRVKTCRRGNLINQNVSRSIIVKRRKGRKELYFSTIKRSALLVGSCIQQLHEKQRVLKANVRLKIKNCLKCLQPIFQFLVVAKIGCENVQLKIKTVKSIHNRYLYFSL